MSTQGNAERPTERVENRREKHSRSITLLAQTGIRLLEAGAIDDFRLTTNPGVHGFYHLTDDSGNTVHIQAFPTMSRDDIAVVNIRAMDTGELQEIQTQGTSSPGNEHAAVRQSLNLKGGVFSRIGNWDVDNLVRTIGEGLITDTKSE